MPQASSSRKKKVSSSSRKPKTFYVCRRIFIVASRDDVTEKVPQYVVFKSVKPKRHKRSKEWKDYDFLMSTVWWEFITDESLHLDPGGGPIKVSINRIR